MTAGREFLNDIGVQSDKFQRMFFGWIESYNGEGDLDILEAFGETMIFLDRFIDCGWWCNDDHAEKHLVATCVSRIRAILHLTALGYPSEALAIHRTLGETLNLMALLTSSPDELKAYRLGSRRQRKKKFSAAKVRGMLKRECLTPRQSASMHRVLSNDYLHLNTLGHIFAYRTSHQEEMPVLPYFHRDLCMSIFTSLVSAADTAILFWWTCAREDDSDIRLAHAIIERANKAWFAFIEKRAQDPTVEHAPMVNVAQ